METPSYFKFIHNENEDFSTTPRFDRNEKWALYELARSYK